MCSSLFLAGVKRLANLGYSDVIVVRIEYLVGVERTDGKFTEKMAGKLRVTAQ